MEQSIEELEPLLLAWPDQLPAHQVGPGLCAMAISLRRLQWHQAESQLLAELALQPQHHGLNWLLIFLRLLQEQLPVAASLLQSRRSWLNSTAWPFWYLHVQLSLSQPDGDGLLELEPLIEAAPARCVWRQLSTIALRLRLGQLDAAAEQLHNFHGPDCLELQRLKARYLLAIGDGQQSLALLTQALERFPQHRGLARQLTILTLDIKAGAAVIPALRHALAHHGESPEFLPQITQVKLLQRQPALARRTALLDRAWASLQQRRTNVPNQLTSYEMNGNVSWFPAMLPALRDPASVRVNSDLLTNLCCQFASIESPIAAELAPALCEQMLRLQPVAAQSATPPQVSRPNTNTGLRIAWITGDLCPHPVSRFLLSFLEQASSDPTCRHLVVGLEDHQDQSLAPKFRALPGVDLLDLGTTSKLQHCDRVREHQPHIAIDLSGWTGGNFQPGFLARLAPLQINYLGYFASTGNPNMDVWLGDGQLFPEPMQEWHSERLHRLERCFIAWQPSAHFPEATAAIPEAASAGGIRFGSFNHNRKLSDATLALWAQILRAIPDAQLVLKANHSSDPGTQTLLRRRLQRQGIDPERVIWLPIAPSTALHQQQYAHVDVALDCFPNGGCTTTCEALWMGVPVITLSGRSYVSRMSTAVLHGANLPNWCAASPQDYLDLAVAQADQLRWLRQNRDHWRRQVQTTPLGDARDLMQHLGRAFWQLAARCDRFA